MVPFRTAVAFASAAVALLVPAAAQAKTKDDVRRPAARDREEARRGDARPTPSSPPS